MLSLRLVVDANVMVSVALKPAGLPRTVLLVTITKPARLYVSRDILQEYREVLSRTELGIRNGLLQQLMELIKRHSHMVGSARRLQVARDADDNIFLECADAAKERPGLTTLNG
jgi:putative PIN family toxin of toxin-antitoxin system